MAIQFSLLSQLTCSLRYRSWEMVMWGCTEMTFSPLLTQKVMLNSYCNQPSTDRIPTQFDTWNNALCCKVFEKAVKDGTNWTDAESRQ